MIFDELTPLQRRLLRAKGIRRAIQELFAEETGLIRGYKQVCNGILRDIVAGLTDNQIRDILYYALQCDDLIDSEREQIERLLDLR